VEQEFIGCRDPVSKSILVLNSLLFFALYDSLAMWVFFYSIES